MSEEMDGKMIHREFAVDLEPSGDGRTLDVRVVPYNVVSRVRDHPLTEPYDEVWLPGVFEKQRNAPNRLLVNVEHERGVSGLIARGIEFRDSEDAFEASVRMLSGQDADKALELVNEGVFTGVSLEAIPQRSIREDGVVKRVKAHLDKLALCRAPAIQGAEVLAVREEIVVPDPPTLELNPEVDELLDRMGFEAIVTRAVVSKAWDGSPARFTDDQYRRSCLIDRGGDAPVKERCSLPVLEPNGDVNSNALGSAAAALAGARGGVGNVTAAQKATAARKLIRYYRRAQMEPPASLRSLASR